MSHFIIVSDGSHDGSNPLSERTPKRADLSESVEQIGMWPFYLLVFNLWLLIHLMRINIKVIPNDFTPFWVHIFGIISKSRYVNSSRCVKNLLVPLSCYMIFGWVFLIHSPFSLSISYSNSFKTDIFFILFSEYICFVVVWKG